MSAPFSIHLRVRFIECDMYGHVNNAHYLTWFDMAHTDMMRAALRSVGSDRDPFSVAVVVAECGIRYLGAAFADDELEVDVTLEPLTTTSMTSRYVVRRGTEILAEAFLRHVCFDLDANTKVPWPADLRAGSEQFVAPTVNA